MTSREPSGSQKGPRSVAARLAMGIAAFACAATVVVASMHRTESSANAGQEHVVAPETQPIAADVGLPQAPPMGESSLPAREVTATSPFAAEAAAEAARKEAVFQKLECVQCHLPSRQRPYYLAAHYSVFDEHGADPVGCGTCHINNKLAATRREGPPAWLAAAPDTLKHVRARHSYVTVPDLTTVFFSGPVGNGPRIRRLTECGVRAFLASPVPRKLGASESMYPLTPARSAALLAALGKDLEPCADVRPDPKAVERGRELFASAGCRNCHGETSEAPLLRIGIPLLSRSFFEARVRDGTAGPTAPPRVHAMRWLPEGDRLAPKLTNTLSMPPFGHLSADDIDALYRYVSEDRSDLRGDPPEETPVSFAPLEDIALYRAVQGQVFSAGCRHCHNDRASDAKSIVTTFGANGVTPIAFPVLGRRPWVRPELKRALSPGANCSESPLVTRLKLRRSEWHGLLPETGNTARRLRGMPLTQPPLSRQAIELAIEWTRRGCPSDAGSLCTTCSSK
ncbi:cytochrome c [Pendulispora rubella]|uniref:Cytochrome c n=1 Tax=Pendulispora rubella TaxID=2741070 RepID=A0ABZ2KUP1_9BACT